ncbi:MAG: hypothetical protein Q8O67_27455 [Deltaproteobacteria bacterium]|nr:hypothetical protein [Deltaproteobacteria bacterium]
MSSSSSSPAAEHLEKEGLTWLIVVAAGFFFGFGWISGPLGWYFGKKLRKQADESRLATPDVVRFAHIGGIVTTIITYVGLIIAFVAVIVIFGFLAVNAPHTSRSF